MTTRAKKRRAPSPRPVELRPTLGPQVCRWIEKSTVHGPGDYFGKPFTMRPFQKRFLWRAYELHPDGSRVVKEALLGLPKGNGKTEVAAAIGCAELGGPVQFDRWGLNGQPIGKRRISPDIPVAAASFEQADRLFGDARVMLKQGPLHRYFEVFDTEILVKDGPGRMYRVAAIAGTNDGGLPTFVLTDELHEWIGKKARVHLVLTNGLEKRANAWSLNITTAGWDIASLLGKKVTLGKRIAAGEVPEDPSFLFEWHEASDKTFDITDRKKLAAAIREANPAADDFLDVETRVKRAQEIPEHEFRRYYLNQWVDAPERWLPQSAWEACTHSHVKLPADGSEVVLVLVGKYSGDSIAIVGATLPADGDVESDPPHVFRVKSWEKGIDDDWKNAVPQIEGELRRAGERWKVRAIGGDPNRFPQTLLEMEDEGLPVVKWQTHLPSRMVPACAQFYDAVKQATVTHDGDERMLAHINNAVVKLDGRGPRIAQEHDNEARPVELAVGAVVAYDLAVRAPAAAHWGIV